jgi:hypothetical protein
LYAGTVEILHGRDPAGVRVRAEVAPVLELAERVGDSAEVDVRQRLVHVLRPQMYGEPPLRDHEHRHDLPVQLDIRRGQVRERLKVATRHRSSSGRTP